MEVDFIFLVSGGEGAEVFEPGEAAFDAIALFIQGFVVLGWQFAVAFGVG